MSLPPELEAFVLERTLEGRRAAWLVASDHGDAVQLGGELALYGLNRIREGDELCAVAEFLEGLLPLTGHSLFLPFVETSSGRFADLHLVPSTRGALVVLLDATRRVEQQSKMIQKVNDFDLLRESLRVRRSTPGTVRRADVSALAVRWSIDLDGGDDDSARFRRTERSTDAMRHVLERSSAVIELARPGLIIAVFGIEPTTAVVARLAIEAAQRLIGTPGTPSVACGVATGAALVGEGDGVRLATESLASACELALCAPPGSILCDRRTAGDSQGLAFREFRLEGGTTSYVIGVE